MNMEETPSNSGPQHSNGQVEAWAPAYRPEPVTNQYEYGPLDRSYASIDYGYGPCEPSIPPERAARKQRPRRGGACYDSLLKSAVQASMETESQDGTRGIGRHNSGGVISLQSLEGPPSPRKRARHKAVDPVDEEGSGGEDDGAIERASSLLGNLCVRMERETPTRRVSRRTSYDTHLSDMTDCDGLDEDED